MISVEFMDFFSILTFFCMLDLSKGDLVTGSGLCRRGNEKGKGTPFPFLI
jgi:hypothetical protein